MDWRCLNFKVVRLVSLTIKSSSSFSLLTLLSSPLTPDPSSLHTKLPRLSLVWTGGMPFPPIHTKLSKITDFQTFTIHVYIQPITLKLSKHTDVWMLFPVTSLILAHPRCKNLLHSCTSDVEQRKQRSQNNRA